ncbi:septation protein IspZ [Shewanella sp. NIFS-20-20]|uniref:septation protein IspZ n=1 Tax=Shewanella sp. NIFS-20-20 TaxID=2853806 RepID=UPI001C4968A7|nr:septation protein IspZ [Shewanella sp. NIFS-20-20]MBV7315037.1 septation protein IspZ [Shewanella sp. NIFS-20-20]
MQQLLAWFPMVIFFAIYQLFGIYLAITQAMRPKSSLIGLTALTLINPVITAFFLYQHLPQNNPRN